MPTVRLRDASEYPAETQKLFESVKEWLRSRRHCAATLPLIRLGGSCLSA